MGYCCNKDLIKQPFSIPINYTSQPLNQNHCNTEETNHEEGEGRSRKTGSSRWNPTREQIMALEELYRGGTRTPTTEQIQEIASKLREFGRIEGKNVFYWFQNHKARERHKRCRLEAEVNNPNEHQHHLVTDNNKVLSVLRRTGGHKVEQTKSCQSSTASQDLVPANNKQNSNSNGTTENSERRSDTWKIPMITSDTSRYNNHHLILASQFQEPDKGMITNQNELDSEEERREIRTLDLFPVNLTGNQEKTDGTEGETEPEGCTGTRKANPNYYYYYEFMPLKN